MQHTLNTQDETKQKSCYPMPHENKSQKTILSEAAVSAAMDRSRQHFFLLIVLNILFSHSLNGTKTEDQQ